jgi:pilus assembly protein Flp/PilA
MQAKNLSRDVRGATAIEYGLIAALISAAIIPSVSVIVPKLNATFDNVSGKF